MTSGFEGQSADQQEGAPELRPRRGSSAKEQALLSRRNRLELSRADIKRRMALAHREAHQETLRRALAALDSEIASLR